MTGRQAECQLRLLSCTSGGWLPPLDDLERPTVLVTAVPDPSEHVRNRVTKLLVLAHILRCEGRQTTVNRLESRVAPMD